MTFKMDNVEIPTVSEALIIRNHPMQGSRLTLSACHHFFYLHFPTKKKTLLLTLTSMMGEKKKYPI